MTQQVKFNMQACRRCGGTGHHSWNATDGSTCYGCAGKGKVRTAAAKRSAIVLKEWLAENASVSLDEVKVGDVIWWSAFPTLGRRAGWGKVDAVEEGRGSAAFTDKGVRYESQRAVIFRSGDRSVQHFIHSARPVTVRRQVTVEERAAYVEFAATLSGVKVVEVEPA